MKELTKKNRKKLTARQKDYRRKKSKCIQDQPKKEKNRAEDVALRIDKQIDKLTHSHNDMCMSCNGKICYKCN